MFATKTIKSLSKTTLILSRHYAHKEQPQIRVLKIKAQIKF